MRLRFRDLRRHLRERFLGDCVKSAMECAWWAVGEDGLGMKDVSRFC